MRDNEFEANPSILSIGLPSRVKMGEDFIEKMTKMEKQKRSFGRLYGPQWSQKKCSEQLRSSSIDGSCQMVRTGTRKMQKWSVCFWMLGLKYRRVIVDKRFYDVFVLAKALKVAISILKLHFWWNFDQKHFFGLLSFCFLYFSRHQIFDFSDICKCRWNNFLVKVQQSLWQAN